MPRGVKTSRAVNKAPRRDLITRDNDGTQNYGNVTKLLGNGRALVVCQIGVETKEIQATIRGSMRRRSWVSTGDTVLIAMRDFGDKHDIIQKYDESEVRELKRLGELGVTTRVDEDEEVTFEDI